MEEEGVDKVLGRATELRLKVRNCIHKATTTSSAVPPDPSMGKENVVVAHGGSCSESPSVTEVGEADDDEVDRLLNICDAFESLESQLSSLQVLQQQQRYEREAALGEIEHSRKMLLEKLKEYKGEHLEVISEASAFAGEAVEHNHDLMLPPYPSRPPYSLHLNNGHVLQSSSARRSLRNGVTLSYMASEAKKASNESLTTNKLADSKNPRNGLGSFLAATLKTVVTIGGVVSVLRLSGFAQKSSKKGTPLKIFGFLQHPSREEKRPRINCPPGKILVVEDGEARCLVKERVEVPFSSAAAKPDVNYGCG